MKTNPFLFLYLIIFFCGCTKDAQQIILAKPSGCDSMEFSYSKDIKPVIEANCMGPTCHGGGNANYDYRTYEVLADRIRTGIFEERLLLPENDPLDMPVGTELSKCDLFTIRVWIHQGFKNN